MAHGVEGIIILIKYYTKCIGIGKVLAFLEYPSKDMGFKRSIGTGTSQNLGIATSLLTQSLLTITPFE